MRRGGRRGGKEGEREEKGGRRERGGEIIRHSVRDEHTAVCKNPFNTRRETMRLQGWPTLLIHAERLAETAGVANPYNTRRETSGDCRGGQPL